MKSWALSGWNKDSVQKRYKDRVQRTAPGIDTLNAKHDFESDLLSICSLGQIGPYKPYFVHAS